MTHVPPSLRLAVLIDGENIPSHAADRIFELVEPLGSTHVRAVYCDFSSNHDKGWKEAAVRHAIEPHQVCRSPSGKNAVDIALAVDAMDLLRDGGHGGICIVSSDSDYVALARRIRAEGCAAYGVGRGTAPELLRLACTAFFQLDPDETAATASAAHRPRPSDGEPAATHAALPAIRAAMARMTDKDGWYCLGAFGTSLGVAPRTFGHTKLSDLLTSTGQCEFKPGAGKQWFRLVPFRAVAS